MPYSAVTQPRPVLRRNGAPAWTDAVHSMSVGRVPGRSLLYNGETCLQADRAVASGVRPKVGYFSPKKACPSIGGTGAAPAGASRRDADLATEELSSRAAFT